MLLSGASFCYLTRSDAVAAVTYLPSWGWAVIGLRLALAGVTKAAKRAGGILGGLWLLYLVEFADEIPPLLRFRSWPDPGWRAAHESGRAIRVVSLNCAGGLEEAAEEVIPFHPDIVLLQETPDRKALERLTRKLFGKEGSFAWGYDPSLLARGTMKPAPQETSRGVNGIQAEVKLSNGIRLTAVSLRLWTPSVRVDFWNPACWREQAENHRQQREQLQAVLAPLQQVPNAMPVLIGGDFNTPARDSHFRLLRPRFRDAFREGGFGWGNTILNDIPLQRIDQLWINEQFQAVSVFARKTRNSDHRMVVCDLLVK